MRYTVAAFERGKEVCAVATLGQPLLASEAVLFARDLRQEFPNAIVAILPAQER